MAAEVRKKVDQLRRGIVPEGYKKTSFGIAPVEWTGTCLGDIYTERKEPGNETLPLLMVSIHSGVSDGEVDEDDLPKKVKRIEDKSQYKRAATGDLVFNMMRAWQGAIGTVRTEGMVSPAYIVAEPNKMVDPLFMDYYMKTDRMVHTIHRQSYGVTDFRLRLYWDSFAPIKCVLPSVAEQQKIAAILTTQDKVIELKEKRLAEKQRQKKYLMQQLLTGQKRLPRFGEKWYTTKLHTVCMYVSEHTTSQTKEYVSTENMLPDLCGNVQFANIEERISGIKYTANDILIGNIRPYLKKVWRADRDGICSTDVLVLRATNISSQYLYLLIANEEFFSYVMVAAKGSKMPRGDKRHIMEKTVSIPSDIIEQQAIINAMVLADTEIRLLQNDVYQEQQKKKALMQLLLTGIVRVHNGK